MINLISTSSNSGAHLGGGGGRGEAPLPFFENQKEVPWF